VTKYENELTNSFGERRVEFQLRFGERGGETSAFEDNKQMISLVHKNVLILKKRVNIKKTDL
jgi:hypothetical protein